MVHALPEVFLNALLTKVNCIRLFTNEIYWKCKTPEIVGIKNARKFNFMNCVLLFSFFFENLKSKVKVFHKIF